MRKGISRQSICTRSNEKEKKIMKYPLISVIVPVYNVERYLDYCIQSIINQTYSNLEIILVDDGSEDTSGIKCDVFGLDDRIKVFHQKNQGPGAARNRGISKANGDYITFVDSDDYLHKDYIRILYEGLGCNRTELSICGVKKVIDSNANISETRVPVSTYKVLNSYELQYKALSGEIPLYSVGKLFRRELFKSITFPLCRSYEDLLPIWHAIVSCKKASYVSDSLYFYRQRQDSITHIKYKHDRMNQLYYSERIMDELSTDSRLKTVAKARCFFAAADSYVLVNSNYPDDIKYLKKALIAYRKDTLHAKLPGIRLKVLAVAAFVSPSLVRILGKVYKMTKRVVLCRSYQL